MVRHRQVRSIATLVGALTVAGAFSTAEAQTAQRGQPRPDSPRIVVVNFRSAENGVGVTAADAVRDRLMRQFNARDLWVIPKKAVDDNLAQSGYPTDEALSQNDAAQLARLLRADEYVDGVVTKTQDGQYKVDARLRLTRNLDLTQPLPSQTVSKPQDAGQAIARAVEDARKQVDDEAACYRLGGEQKYEEAIAAARKGIEEYPQATLARVCLINIMSQQKAPADQMLATAQEILAIDPASRTALRYAYESQRQLGQTEEATNTLLRLLAADPGNAQIQNAVVNELAGSRRFGLADSVITEALERNPGDPELMRTAFNVYYAAERWAKTADIGEQVVQIDTAFATPTFFVRLASAYGNDSQPQKAAEAIARGTAKFPQDASLLVSAADMYRDAGQLQQAIQALNKALQVDPKAPNANLTLAQIYADMNQPDSAIAALRTGLAAGDSAQLVAGLAAQIGQRAYQAASQSKSREDYMRAIPFLRFADETSPSNPVKLVLGVSAYTAGLSAVQEAQQAKSCELARTAKEMFGIANRAIVGGGGTVDAGTAGQIMSGVQQADPYADQLFGAFCR